MEPNPSGDLPLCDSQSALGRWVYTHSLYPLVRSAGVRPASAWLTSIPGPQDPGEPLQWKPYGCRHNHYTGKALGQCMAQLKRTKFIGESTLGEAGPDPNRAFIRICIPGKLHLCATPYPVPP